MEITTIIEELPKEVREALGSGNESFRFKNTYKVELWRKGVLIREIEQHNTCTAEGLTSLLGREFHADTQITAWFTLIFEDDVTPADGTTYAVPVFTESTAYDEATRPAFNEAAASNKSITNSANKAEFTMNATKTIYGAALVGGGTDADTKNDQAGGGTLFCASKFASSIDVLSTDVLKVQISITTADT